LNGTTLEPPLFSPYNTFSHKSNFIIIISDKELWEMPGEGLGVGGDAGEGERESPHLHHLLNSDTLQVWNRKSQTLKGWSHEI
jgi:hypothetical protein